MTHEGIQLVIQFSAVSAQAQCKDNSGTDLTVESPVGATLKVAHHIISVQQKQHQIVLFNVWLCKISLKTCYDTLNNQTEVLCAFLCTENKAP